MKTRKQCFDEARQLFCQHNPGILEQIKDQAAAHAEVLGLSEAEFIKDEINKAFGHFVNSLGEGSTAKIIEMMAPDEATEKALLRGHYPFSVFNPPTFLRLLDKNS
ncbi:DUF6388 family protein [Franconibacter daqui]|uniref:DUF6388 family protein n=1 Tax=Franconibacter daqui TaxID=2047724 RepID=UPI002DBCE32E|nr:DUF6388 family protein [Franconibacter daqui]MEB5922019.1 hypothetical protein [Franconibacter daqui]